METPEPRMDAMHPTLAPKPRAGRPALLALLLTLLLGACGGPVFQQPEVSLEGVELAGLGLRGGTLLVDLRVVNPNRFSLSADQLAYELALADTGAEPGERQWHAFASGMHEEDFAVAARDTAVIQVPVEFTYASLGTAATSLLRAGTFDYRATGEVDVRTPLGRHGVPFRRTGTITLMGER